MSEPEKTKGLAMAVANHSETGPRDQGPSDDSTARRFVVVCPRDDGGRRIFGRYERREQAEHFASALRRVGCPAEIEERCAEQPEFGTSRRAFLIYALACGLVKPERVTERVVAELAEETREGSTA